MSLGFDSFQAQVQFFNFDFSKILKVPQLKDDIPISHPFSYKVFSLWLL
jgi:hypothetical protein